MSTETLIWLRYIGKFSVVDGQKIKILFFEAPNIDPIFLVSVGGYYEYHNKNVSKSFKSVSIAAKKLKNSGCQRKFPAVTLVVVTAYLLLEY